ARRQLTEHDRIGAGRAQAVEVVAIGVAQERRWEAVEPQLVRRELAAIVAVHAQEIGLLLERSLRHELARRHLGRGTQRYRARIEIWSVFVQAQLDVRAGKER